MTPPQAFLDGCNLAPVDARKVSSYSSAQMSLGRGEGSSSKTRIPIVSYFRALHPRWFSVLLLSLAPAVDYFGFYLHRHPLGVVGAEAGVENFLHPIDHCLHEPSLNLLGLLLAALDDNLIVDG